MKKLIWFLGVGLFLILSTLSARAESPQGDFTALQKVITEVSQSVQPAVVHIQAILKQENRKITVVGSGVIVDAKGYIITNDHVVSKAVKITVTIPNFKKKFPAKVLGTDKQTDLAVIQIQPEGQIPVAQLGNSDQVQVGQWVLAIGNPYGLDGTVTLGIVSGRGRNVENGPLITDFLQTDAMIDFGSSGGPLVNLNKEVIGINSMMQGRGIGFTIPVNTVLEVRDKILSSGKIDRGWIGVTFQPLNRDLAEYFGIPSRSGVVVNAVFSGSPAERAGLAPGDIISEFAGSPVECENDEDIKNFVRMVSKTGVGKEAEVGLIRQGQEKKVKIKVGEQPEIEPEEVETDLGFYVKPLTDLFRFQYRVEAREGVFVSFVEPGSVAGEAGLGQAQVIVEIEGQKIKALENFRKAIEKVKDKERFLVTVQDGKDTRYLLFKHRPKGRDSSVGRAADS